MQLSRFGRFEIVLPCFLIESKSFGVLAGPGCLRLDFGVLVGSMLMVGCLAVD